MFNKTLRLYGKLHILEMENLLCEVAESFLSLSKSYTVFAILCHIIVLQCPSHLRRKLLVDVVFCTYGPLFTVPLVVARESDMKRKISRHGKASREKCGTQRCLLEAHIYRSTAQAHTENKRRQVVFR